MRNLVTCDEGENTDGEYTVRPKHDDQGVRGVESAGVMTAWERGLPWGHVPWLTAADLEFCDRLGSTRVFSFLECLRRKRGFFFPARAPSFRYRCVS